MTPNPEPTQLQRRMRKLTRPLFLFAGVAYIVAGILKFVVHQNGGWIYIGLGLAFLVLAWVVPLAQRET